MIRVTTRSALADAVSAARAAGGRIGFVPTMGFLHEGHLDLCDIARAHADVVVMSIFVNPLQFGPNEDFARYPRDLERDASLAEARGVDILYAPDVNEMYPHSETRVFVTADELENRLCGAYRPGHFRGVLTVVAKLFHMVSPDVAVFGQKDLQQSVLIRRMVDDLDFPVRIVVAPITRETDGLAMSSRNVYLSATERALAPQLHRALQAGREMFESGTVDASRIIDAVRNSITHATSTADARIDIQYIELVDTDTLDAVTTARPGNAIAIAAYLGRTRLIDNLLL